MKPKMPDPPKQAPPVNTSQTVGEQTSAELVTANEQGINTKKKKKLSSGTSSMNTSSGLNIPTDTTL